MSAPVRSTLVVEARHLSRMACCAPLLPARVTSYVVEGMHIIECQCGAMWNGTEESFHMRADDHLDRLMDHVVAIAKDWP